MGGWGRREVNRTQHFKEGHSPRTGHKLIITEVGDRWAPGMDSWCLSNGLKLKLCSQPDTPKTKLVAEAELC